MSPAVGPAWKLRIRHILFAFLALATPAHAQSVIFTYENDCRQDYKRFIFREQLMRFPPSLSRLELVPPSITTTVLCRRR